MAKIASETVAPYIKKMEKEQKIADEVLQSLFSNGVSLFNIYMALLINNIWTVNFFLWKFTDIKIFFAKIISLFW